jgi:hypothetical protein
MVTIRTQFLQNMLGNCAFAPQVKKLEPPSPLG